MGRKYIFIFLLIFLTFNQSVFSEPENYSFLNKDISYKIIIPKGDAVSLHPEESKIVYIKYEGRKIYINYSYYVFGEITDRKMKLMEYNTLIKKIIRDFVVPVDVLGLLDREKLYSIHKELYLRYQLFKSIKVPAEVKEIHKKYIEFMKPFKEYLDFETEDESVFKNTTIVYRILSDLNSYTNRRVMQKADIKCFEILNKNNIQPR